jgi:hypothetical protein
VQRAATPTSACEALALEPRTADPNQARALLGFTMPAGTELLRIDTRWSGQSKRALALGPGPCPPCEHAERRKGRGEIAVELLPSALGSTEPDFGPAAPWFVEIEADPDGDDLARVPGVTKVEACTLDAEALADGVHRLLPSEGLVPGSLITIERDAFGFDRLEGVHTARYARGDTELTAFVLPLEDPGRTRELATAYRDFLLSLGGSLSSSSEEGTIELVELWGAHTAILTTPRGLAGVQEAEDARLAMALARELEAWLEGSP